MGVVAALASQLDLLVCPDGGLMHVAAAVGCPTLSMFFETDPRIWRHAGPRHRALAAASPAALDPETVFQEASSLLKAPA